MNEKLIKPFKIKIEEIFYFRDGTTVFAGEIFGGGSKITPCIVDVFINENPITNLHLHGERMPGQNTPSNYRIVFTRDKVKIDDFRDKNLTFVYTGLE